MFFKSILIANRGEIAVRIARAAAEMGIASVAIFAEDDAHSLHVRRADRAVALTGKGAAAYLDAAQIVQIALESGCDAIHPGYGFLAENADFAALCAQQGIRFIGPSPAQLRSLGDKVKARALAEQCGVPLLRGSLHATTLEQADQFMAALGPNGAIMIKAVAGGGGRGMRAVLTRSELADAYARCQSEAKAAFGNSDVYVEQLVTQARHIEVQILGDGSGAVIHLGERECSLQRRHQKLVEIAPSPSLNDSLRQAILAAACRLAEAIGYQGLGTFEFLVDTSQPDSAQAFFFIEANPRIQVEHTVTEQVSGVDLVQTQIALAAGKTLAELGLHQAGLAPLRGYAVQLRINLETMHSDGSARPSGGTLGAYEPPSGPGIRVDGYGYSGYTTSPNYDSLLAKLIVHSPVADYPALLKRAYRALCEFRIEGVVSNIHFLQNLISHEAVQQNHIDTRFIEREVAHLLAPQRQAHPHYYFSQSSVSPPLTRVDTEVPAGCEALTAPVQGLVVSLDLSEGDQVAVGQQIAVLEAMKMEFEVKAQISGTVRQLATRVGANVFEGNPLFFIAPAEVAPQHQQEQQRIDLSLIRQDLADVMERQQQVRDERRPEAVARRRKTGQRTARENLASLVDEDSFIEYGALNLAAQRKGKTLPELIKSSPADGLIAGIGTVNGALFNEQTARCMVLAYDYTVFAGTQGWMNHKKTDRMLKLAEQWQLPLVLFAEGGGGRPNDIDVGTVAMLDNMTFIGMAKLSGLVPLVGIVSGRCFAGNAALLGCCDVIIATENATIGMAGPAMIEGGGLGKYLPEEVGPVSIQAPNGVIDVLVKDEAEAVQVAKQYLSYFQGPLPEWSCVDQRLLRHLIPENRLRVYDIRQVIDTLADDSSVLELRKAFAPGMITAFIRIEGRPFGLMANNPQHLGGAIDAAAGDKAARFMQLCDAFDIPMISLCDTPGFMVGPDAEKTATVRHLSRMFVTAASLTVPFFTLVVRKGYGLGAQAMSAGSFHSALFTIAWPSAEFGAMGIEGAVRLGFVKELEAIADPEQRQQRFEQLVQSAYQQGKGMNMASYHEIDDVIDPMETRRWLVRGLMAQPPSPKRTGRKRPFIDTW